ncbi:hypothetical protein Q31b_55150 [Novipirellula aureliae]|uniref:Uncharacterized protein n=1 Tax=Novipirellula aureliae TaxID=2527966 RepID=A0A5C6DFP4_9BACT|nr:hypothetical protein [Novipirellula aureliae]TWU34561.1 hypothetical protein Q31b_55150 [Novipirellula aureliae]
MNFLAWNMTHLAAILIVFVATIADAQVVDRSTEEFDQDQVAIWINQLGADEFAQREYAAGQLIELGVSVLPPLQDAAERTTDPEVRLRSRQLILQLTSGDLQQRTDSFLAGDEVPFEGWGVMQSVMGDSYGVRKLFVELLMSHADVVKSLDGSARDRAIAMQSAVGRIRVRKYEKMQMPTRSDILAMLLPGQDSNVPISEADESLMLSMLRQATGNELHRDLQLGGPVDALVGNWINRSSLANRDETIFFALSWDLESVVPLAIRTLDEATTADQISMAMQAIAQHGTRQDGKHVAKFLDDTRIVAARRSATGEKLETQLGDVAMATIAMANGMKLSEVGFAKAEQHPLQAFILEEIGFPSDDPSKRQATRKRIDAILEGNANSLPIFP